MTLVSLTIGMLIEENLNDKLFLYVSPTSPDQRLSGVVWKIVTIESGNYNGQDLALEMQAT